MKKQKRFITLLFLSLALACATAGPSPEQAVLSANKTLAALEHGMSLYCERADRDADVCAMARKVDNDAFTAVMAATAAVQAGQDPTAALETAQTALASLADVLAGVR